MVSPAVQCVASLSLVGPVTGCDKGRFQGFYQLGGTGPRTSQGVHRK